METKKAQLYWTRPKDHIRICKNQVHGVPLNAKKESKAMQL